MNRLHFFSEPKLPQGHKLHFFIIFCYYNLYSSCSTFGINYTKLLTMRVNYNPKPKNGLRILNHFSSFHGFYKLFMLLLLNLLSCLETFSFFHCRNQANWSEVLIAIYYKTIWHERITKMSSNQVDFKRMNLFY